MTRLLQAWRAMGSERRLAAIASLGLFFSMFLHWYSKTDTVVVGGTAKSTQTNLSAFQAFSFVEAAVLLVCAGVLALLFARAEGRDFRLPGGDGTIVMLAGAWAAVLIFYRLIDKPGLKGTQRITATVGVEWGIFVALLIAIGLAYAGWRMRAGERPEPPLTRRRARHQHPDTPASAGRASDAGEAPDPEEDLARRPARAERAALAERRARPPRPAPVAAERPRGRYPPAPHEQMSFEDQPPGQD